MNGGGGRDTDGVEVDGVLVVSIVKKILCFLFFAEMAKKPTQTQTRSER